MALDVDVVECHGSGRFIADAVEAAASARSFGDGGCSEAKRCFFGGFHY